MHIQFTHSAEPLEELQDWRLAQGLDVQPSPIGVQRMIAFAPQLVLPAMHLSSTQSPAAQWYRAGQSLC